MRGELGVARNGRKRALAPALVGDLVQLGDADRERRNHVEEERGEVIVREQDHDVGALALEPGPHRRIAVEQRLPVGALFLVPVDRSTHRRGMR